MPCWILTSPGVLSVLFLSGRHRLHNWLVSCRNSLQYLFPMLFLWRWIAESWNPLCLWLAHWFFADRHLPWWIVAFGLFLPFSKYAPELFLLVSFLIRYIPHTCLLYFICSSTKIHLFLQITKFGYRLCRPPSVFSEISFKKIIFLKDISMYRFWCLLYYKNSLLWLDLIKLLSVVLTNRGIRLPFPRKVRQSLCLFVWCTDFFSLIFSVYL